MSFQKYLLFHGFVLKRIKRVRRTLVPPYFDRAFVFSSYAGLRHLLRFCNIFQRMQRLWIWSVFIWRDFRYHRIVNLNNFCVCSTEFILFISIFSLLDWVQKDSTLIVNTWSALLLSNKNDSAEYWFFSENLIFPKIGPNLIFGLFGKIWQVIFRNWKKTEIQNGTTKWNSLRNGLDLKARLVKQGSSTRQFLLMRQKLTKLDLICRGNY